MREENRKNGIENLASHRIHGVLPKKYHMEYRSGQEDLMEDKSLKDIENLIRETSKNIEVPESLLPENMGRKLLFLQKKKRRRRRWMIGIVTVLLLCIVAFGIVAWKNRHLNQERLNLNQLTSYEELYEHYVDVIRNDDPYGLYGEQATNLSAVMSSSGEVNSVADGVVIDYAGFDISTGTNLRETGVGEGDFTVTDGKYIYTLNYASISRDSKTGMETYELTANLNEVNGENIVLAGTIHDKFQDIGKSNYNDWEEPQIYVYENMLVMVHSECKIHDGWEIQTRTVFYDISNRQEPKFVKESTQSGLFKDCREIDGKLYVISMKNHIMLNGRGKEKESRYIPMVDGEKLHLEDIYYQKEIQGNSIDIVTSWDLTKQGEKIDAKGIVGYFQNVYMTEKSIYFSNTVFRKEEQENDENYTQISKLSIEKGKLQAVATVKFPGNLDSSFAIQERGNVLWVTVQRRHYFYRDENRQDYTEVNVYSFDENMNYLDRLLGLCKNEEIKAVRYVGEVGYFVSYEEKDPLISVDLSDPNNIKTLDELELPGFSEYLHPLQEDLMLGIGKTEENKLKLELYDVADAKKLSRLDKKVLSDKWNCSVLDDYKWLMWDSENQLIGFSAESGCWGATKGVDYFLYTYHREKGLEQTAKIALDTKKKYGDWQGFRIGSYLYLVEKNSKQGKIQVVELVLG